MYVHPILVGVIGTLLVEFALIIGLGFFIDSGK